MKIIYKHKGIAVTLTFGTISMAMDWLIANPTKTIDFMMPLRLAD